MVLNLEHKSSQLFANKKYIYDIFCLKHKKLY